MPPRLALAAIFTMLLVAEAAARDPGDPGEPDARDQAHLELVVGGLGTLSNAAAPPGERDVVYLLDQHGGRVLLVEDGALVEEPVLELGARLIEETNIEEGLVGLALPPDGGSDLFVSYVARSDELVVSRFSFLDDGRHADPASEAVLLRVPRNDRYHYCGHLEFGPHDGLLYVCVGDSQDNQGELDPVSQDLGRLHGKILRLDPRLAVPTVQDRDGIVARAAAAAAGMMAPEVWLHGLRNPWRFGFDPDAGVIFLPDVGRYHWEELNVLPLDRPGGNFGWPLAEGGECLIDCAPRQDLLWPVFEYPRLDDRCAIMGGATYRGTRTQAWRGVYLFGDFCSGRIWALRDPLGRPEVRLLLDTETLPVAFTRDHAGEVLLVDGAEGAVWRIRLPADQGTGWRSAAEVAGEMALAARRLGFSRTKELLDQAQIDREYMLASRRWRMTEPLVQVYNALGRPFD